MPDYTSLFTIKPSPNPAGWKAAPGGIIDLEIRILQGPCTNVNLSVSPGTLRFVDSGSATTNQVISPAVASGGLILRQLRVPATFAGSVTMGGVVTTKGGGWPVGGGSAPKDANAGPWPLTLITTPEPPLPPEAGTGLALTWHQAEFLAMQHGARIKQAIWKDRVVEYANNVFFLQLINPVTGVAGARSVVGAADWSALPFRARDWTVDGAVDALALAEARAITTTFP